MERIPAIFMTFVLVLILPVARLRIHECPDECRCLDKGSVMTCLRAQLLRVPHLLSTAMVLDLDYNRISIIQNSSFCGAPRLEVLSLQYNGITAIDTGAFTGVTELRVLRLGYNRLTTLPGGVFYDNHNLMALDLHHNSFLYIPDQVMYHLHSLQLLNISFNQLTTPALGPGFQYTTRLQNLDLSRNNFISVEGHVFQVALWWDQDVNHHLNLSYCRIRHIHQHALKRMVRLESLNLRGNTKINQSELKTALLELDVTALEVLNLSHMNLTDISDVFRRFQHRKLRALNLSHNRISTVQQRTFFYLENLQVLDLSYNMIRHIGDLGALVKLQVLNMAYNNIDTIDDTTLEGLQSLRVLDISHNRLRQLTDTAFQTLWDLHTLIASGNRIKNIAFTTGLESLETFDISSNLISNTNFIKRLLTLRHLDLSSNNIRVLGPNTFAKEHRLEYANFSQNAIYSISHQTFAFSIQGTVDLSNNRLTSLSHFNWRGIRTLLLQGNSIYNLSINSFQGIPDLEELNLGDNQLVGFPPGSLGDLSHVRTLDVSGNPIGSFLEIGWAVHMLNTLRTLENLRLARVELMRVSPVLFQNLTALRELDLSGNRIYTLPSNIFQTLTRLRTLNLSNNALSVPNPDAFDGPNKLRSFDLTLNPFDCTCHLMAFRRWLFNNHPPGGRTGPVSQHYTCSSPAEWKGVALEDFHLNSWTCSHQEKTVILTATGCLLVAMILITILVVYRHKWKPKKKADTRYSTIENSLSSSNSTVQENGTSAREWV